MTEIKIFGCSEFDKIKSEWESLQNGEDMTVFQQYIWYYGLNEQYLKDCFKKSETAQYYVVYKDGKAKMIAPVHIRKHGVEYKGIGISSGIYMIGQWSFTDYLNFIYNDFDEECAKAVIAELKKNYPRLSVHFNFVKESNAFDRFLKENYPESGTGQTICVQTLPHDSFEDYYHSLSKHTRQNIRTGINREKNSGIDIHIEKFNTISKQNAEEFFSIYVSRSKNKNTVNLRKDGFKNSIFKFYNKKYNNNLKAGLKKFNYLTYSMENNPQSCLIGIFSGPKKIGFIYCLRENNGDLRNSIVCFDEIYGFYTPGITSFYRYFKDYVYSANERTAVTIDMTRGTEKYKYALGGTEHYLSNYKI